jgi:hypothetical protein
MLGGKVAKKAIFAICIKRLAVIYGGLLMP